MLGIDKPWAEDDPNTKEVETEFDHSEVDDSYRKDEDEFGAKDEAFNDSGRDDDHIVIEYDEVIAGFEEDPDKAISESDIGHARELISNFLERVGAHDYKEVIDKMDGSLADSIMADIFGEGLDLDEIDTGSLEAGAEVDDNNPVEAQPRDEGAEVDNGDAGVEASPDADDDDPERFDLGGFDLDSDSELERDY